MPTPAGPPAIALVTESDIRRPSGFNSRIRAEIALLREAGASVHVIVCPRLGPWRTMRGPSWHTGWPEGLASVSLWLSPPSRGAAWCERLRQSYLVRKLVRFCRARGISTVHLHSPQCGCLGPGIRRLLPGARVVFEPHGIAAAEFRVLGLSEAEVAVAEEQERQSAAGCTQMLTVSRAMTRHYESYLTGPAPESLVIPSVTDFATAGLTDADRTRARADLGVDDAPLVLYVGGLQPWQEPESMWALVAGARSLRPDLRLLVLTMAPEDEARVGLRAAGVPDACAIVRPAPRSEVLRLSTAADVALLLRRRDPVNEVASPVKFGEYLTAGVPVVTTPWVGDCGAIVEERGVGVVVDPWGGDDAAHRLVGYLGTVLEARASIAAACRETATELLSWPAYAGRFLTLMGVGREPEERP